MKEIATRRPVNLGSFKSDTTPSALKTMLFPPAALDGQLFFDLFMIEKLTIGKMVGLGRTNLTLIRPDIVQADNATPFATFDRSTGQRAPVAQFHFRPDAYGITQTGDYVASFLVECPAACSFRLAGSPQVANQGMRTVSGKRAIQVVIKSLPPGQDLFAFIEQTAGTRWSFFQARIAFPLPIFQI